MPLTNDGMTPELQRYFLLHVQQRLQNILINSKTSIEQHRDKYGK